MFKQKERKKEGIVAIKERKKRGINAGIFPFFYNQTETRSFPWLFRAWYERSVYLRSASSPEIRFNRLPIRPLAH